MGSETGMIAAVLRDVLEDTPWTTENLMKEGISDEMLNVVDSLTRRERETYEEFMERVRLQPAAGKVKVVDLEDNMDIKRIRKPSEKDWERLKKYHRAWLRLSDLKVRQLR